MLTNKEIKDKYGRHAGRYDLAVHLYRLIGLRMKAYRRFAVESLRLERGSRVVDLGCGTGLNFPLIEERIGEEGRLIGVDLSPDMLALARQRAERSGWGNIELVQSDMAEYDFPVGVNAVLSTGAFGFVAEYEKVIERASRALAPGGRMVILDGKLPRRWPSWLVRLFVRVSRPFGVTPDYLEKRCWETIERLFVDVSFKQWYGGLIYMSSGTAASPAGGKDSKAPHQDTP